VADAKVDGELNRQCEPIEILRIFVNALAGSRKKEKLPLKRDSFNNKLGCLSVTANTMFACKEEACTVDRK
jgi:hypothetical protein